jgi:hypothetical protein
MTHKLDADDFFIHRIQQQCAQRGLNFFLIEPLWVEAFRIYYELGEVWARVLLNMHCEHHLPDDTFHRLVRIAHERRTHIIDPPDLAQAAFNKALLHPRLVAAGINVPYTVIVPIAEAPQFQLSAAQRDALGVPFVIKPSMGYGRRGVVQHATGPQDLPQSISVWPDQHYLFQRRIVPRFHHEDPLYFRVYYVFGSLWFAWWNCFTDRYRSVTQQEIDQLHLSPLSEIVCRIARLTGMNFFSSEIAQTESGEFVAIDYVNDQCHMLCQSAHPAIGVPDDIVEGIARRLVEGAHQLMAQGALYKRS